MTDKTTFLLLFFFSLTSLEIAMGSPREHRVINRLKVGSIREYKPIPSVDMALVRAIFIIIPNTLVIRPPNIKIMVDFINLFFIFNIYVVSFFLEMYQIFSYEKKFFVIK